MVRGDRHRQVEHHAEEGLVRGREQERRAESGEALGVAQQLQRLRGRLAEVESGVDDDAVFRDSGVERPLTPLDQERSTRSR
jgi:hypothetical protein